MAPRCPAPTCRRLPMNVRHREPEPRVRSTKQARDPGRAFAPIASDLPWKIPSYSTASILPQWVPLLLLTMHCFTALQFVPSSVSVSYQQ